MGIDGGKQKYSSWTASLWGGRNYGPPKSLLTIYQATWRNISQDLQLRITCTRKGKIYIQCRFFFYHKSHMDCHEMERCLPYFLHVLEMERSLAICCFIVQTRLSICYVTAIYELISYLQERYLINWQYIHTRVLVSLCNWNNRIQYGC